MKKNNRYFHYTVYGKLPSIMKIGYLKCATIGVLGGIKPAVWFSTNTSWEETVRKQWRNKEGTTTEPLSRDELFKLGFKCEGKEVDKTTITEFTPVRIEVDYQQAKLKSWNNYKKTSGESKESLNALVKQAKKWGASPKEWYVSYEPISLDCTLTAERWNGFEWVYILSE